MTLNLDKNKSVLVHAYKEVLDERNPINWALFGYDGQTYDLTLVSKGDGDLEEMIEDFNSGKIQYALCRVKIKEKNVEKIVLINWQGEGAPLARKGMCANHLGTIRNFFKGVHITLNARTDEDVEPDLILQMVSKAVAGEGVKISSVIEPDAPPVGAVYKRTNPQEEINSKAKDDFWRKEEQEEERRKREESNRHRKFSVDEVKLLRKESQDYFDKEEQEVALLKNSIANAKQQKSPSPQPPPYNFNGNSNGINGNSNGFNKSAHAHSNSNSSSSSPIPPNERAAITAAALSASTPMKNSNSDLVRQRIKSFDGGSTGPVFPIKNNSQTKINGNSSASNSPVNFNGSSSPASSLKVNSVGSTGIKSPTGITGSKSPTGNGTGNGDNSGESEKRLSVRNRKILFESGGASNTVGSSTIGRKNPAEEIRQAQAQEELKKKQQQEKEKAKPEPEEPKLISPTAHFQSSIISKSIPAQLPEKVPEVIQPPPSFNDKVPDVVAQVSKAKEIEIPPPTFFANSPLPKSPSPQPTAHVQAPSTIINKAAAMADYDEEIFEDTSVRSAQNSFVSETNTKGQSSPRPASVSPLPVNGNSHGVNGDEDLNGGETITIEITPDMGICARALYDYQAADETEITFDPGDIIRNIEKIDEGWWEGLGPADQYGLFPANYVELLN